MEFHKQRRQQFLTESVYYGERKYFEEKAAPRYLDSLLRQDFDVMDRKRNANAYFDESFTVFLLRYTAGDSIDILREDLDHLIFSLEQATKYVREFEKDETFPPLRFVEIDEYERIVQIIGLCFLLHRRDLLPRVAAIFDPSSAAQDILYEDMLAFEIKGRFDVDSWYHEEPYRDLINCLFRDTDEEIVSDLSMYLKNWYRSFDRAPWHDSHLRIDGDMSAGYFGYWAIEAAAIAYLLKVDDSSFREQIVYPKDLVDYARSRDESTIPAAELKPALLRRVPGGESCPKSGYWMTPASLGSRRFFKIGELMPVFSSSTYGTTIWQWSEEQ